MPQVSLRKSTIALVLSLFCGYTVTLNGQITPADSLYLWFDEQIGLLNTGLYASQEYVEEYQVINEKHRFFESPNYLTGTLWQKNVPFHKVFLKYDLLKTK